VTQERPVDAMTNPDYRAMCAELTTALEAVDNLANLALHHYAWDGRRPKVVQELIDRARALLDQPEPVVADLHYAWELEDAEGEWQAGGSADSLEDVQREGSRYLETYSQDGPHKLIIQRHCVTTIEEATNAQ
jgi:hypothetical protein